jgi:hypothetical protein
MALIWFSGFSGKSIDILDFHDSENKELTPPRITFFNSILSAHLISVLDFILRSRDVAPSAAISVKLNCRLRRTVWLETHQNHRVIARASSDVDHQTRAVGE